jgi:hypothetical protein
MRLARRDYMGQCQAASSASRMKNGDKRIVPCSAAVNPKRQPNQDCSYTRHVINTQRWYFPLCILLATYFGVFVLPFLLPPPYLAGISAANVAGFNNKVASLAAAALGTFVFFAALRWPRLRQERSDRDFGRLPRPLILTTVISCGCMVAVLGYLIAISGQHYGDGRYFIRQISMHIDYGRKLYDQIELPYGPLLFYGPVIVHAVLSLLHISTAAAYYTTLVLEHVIGLLLVVYVLDRLPILRKWKIVFLLLCLLHTYPFGFGLNYTFFRFVLPIAFLVLATGQTGPWTLGAYLFAGQAASLSLSPEMGLAFGASSIAYATYCFLTAGRAWLVAVAAPFVATAAFLVLAGGGYLRMLKLFARGIANFVVEPIPYILVFLFALIWLAPLMLARFFRDARPEAPLLGALYIFSVALVPVAFGRADPGHVFFSGIGIYLLSLVAISDARPHQQVAWVTCVVLVLTWTAFVDDHFYWPVLRARIRYDASHWQNNGLMRAAHAFTEKVSPAAEELLFSARGGQDEDYGPLDLKGLQAIVGNDPVALPLTVPVPVEETLKRSGQFIPTFYDREWSILDTSAEDRQLKEMNAARWALLPEGPIGMFTETQDSVAPHLGHRLPYHSPYPMKREPYVIGRRFEENLQANWQLCAELGKYEVYRRRD